MYENGNFSRTCTCRKKKLIFGGVSFFDRKMQGLNLAKKEFIPLIVDDSGELKNDIRFYLTLFEIRADISSRYPRNNKTINFKICTCAISCTRFFLSFRNTDFI